VRGQTDLDKTFACIANVGIFRLEVARQGAHGGGAEADQRAGRLQRGLSPRGRAADGDDHLHQRGHPEFGSDGTPAEWAQAVIDAKGGDEESVVAFNIGGTGTRVKPADRVCQMAKMFTYHHLVHVEEPDYGPGFVEAARARRDACAGFVPPPG
jgi:hypothetical protein